MTEQRTIFEVRSTSIDTFDNESTYVAERYYDEAAANMHAYLLSQGWGTRATVDRVDPVEISSDSVAQVREKHGFYSTKKLSRKEVLAIGRGEMR